MRLKEVHAVQSSNETQVRQLVAKHKEEMASVVSVAQAKYSEAMGNITEAHKGQLSILQSALSQATLERDQTIATAKLREEQMLEQMQQAVKEAKSKVYEKAKSQFEIGNKEFCKLKAQFKEANNDRSKTLMDYEKVQNENKVLTLDVQNLKTIIDELRAEVSLLKSGADEFVSHVLTRFTSSSEIPSIANISHAEKVALFKATINTQYMQYTDAVEEKESLHKKLIDLKLQLETKEDRIVFLAKQISSMEASSLSYGDERELLTKEIVNLKRERDAQMTVVAKLMVQNSTTKSNDHDQKLAALQRSNSELEERCSSLRAMNEEILGMLEKFQGI